MDFSDQRVSYEKSMLDESNLPTDAFVLLHQWIQTAIDKQVNEPYAMSLATCGDDGMPSVRIVLMREITENGLVFYTNYLSAKAQDMLENPHAEVLFFWHELERQIRIRGTIKKLPEAQSDAYFHKRPHDSQLAAWVSQPQSGVVESRDVMEQKFAELKAEYPDDAVVPRPEFWGGYELLADEIEFWQGRANRMHDRIVYQRQSAQDSGWHVERRLP
ncbi:pyridoxamine 5'-phosphate oxidase [Psychrobacter sp. I-STPA6b]|uniref:pyridoxamine 5'-phosphate oxidase n=1 Tax=Psychrobacter sp. I-STPA6b TaxID=2585718 RepID=UPI001D0C0762|nr:pyridoxamine 5'-phosphate oxidase [Psychrobacter sp. I-STPA6b]